MSLNSIYALKGDLYRRRIQSRRTIDEPHIRVGTIVNTRSNQPRSTYSFQQGVNVDTKNLQKGGSYFTHDNDTTINRMDVADDEKVKHPSSLDEIYEDAPRRTCFVRKGINGNYTPYSPPIKDEYKEVNISVEKKGQRGDICPLPRKQARHRSELQE